MYLHIHIQVYYIPYVYSVLGFGKRGSQEDKLYQQIVDGNYDFDAAQLFEIRFNIRFL